MSSRIGWNRFLGPFFETIFGMISGSTRLYVVYTVATHSRDKIAWKMVAKNRACKPTLRNDLISI